MKRELIEQTGGYDPTLNDWEDWEFWIHALSYGMTGIKVEVPTHLYRRHGSASKYFSDRAAFRKSTRRLRSKHAALYGDLGAISKKSAIGLPERLVYRWLWGERPWPAWMELTLHSVLFRVMLVVDKLRSTTTTVR